MAERPWTADEMATIVAARRLAGASVCFAGIGLPSAAAILASKLHAPNIYLVYESGVLGAQPNSLPLSVADQELAETAQTIVSVPEIFAYWLQPGRIDVGVLGAAQVDRFGNINSTVIGAYGSPKVRLPGAGGAPEIASACAETLIILRHDRRVLVEALDFVTTIGHGLRPGHRQELGFIGKGPSAVITDMAILEPDPARGELMLTALHPGATVDQVRQATGWDLRIGPSVERTAEPTAFELETLRHLQRGARDSS
jgi:glutaconate CoA-transferase subunit B